jgi:hypothetical protein
MQVIGRLSKRFSFVFEDNMVRPFIINTEDPELLKENENEVDYHNDGRNFPWGSFPQKETVCTSCNWKNTYNTKLCLQCKNLLPSQEGEALPFMEPIYPYGQTGKRKKKEIETSKEGKLVEL